MFVKQHLIYDTVALANAHILNICDCLLALRYYLYACTIRYV